MNPIQSVSNDQIHEIVVFLHQYDGLLKHLDTLNNVVSLLKVTERPFFAPVTNGDFDRQPNLSRHLDMYLGSTNDDFESLLSEIGKEISMADIVAELGYGCTVDNTRCKEILSIVEPLDDVAISKLLGAVVGTHSGLGDAHNRYATFVSAILNSHTNDSSQLTKWNADVLVDSINELAPSTNWVRVMEYLDHEGFNIPDETGFYLLMSIYTRACKDPFPLHAVCGSLWKNREGQISFLKHAVSASPDKFTFAHSSRHLEFQDLAGPSQGNHAWSCLDLLEVLCQLAEVGYATSVRSMLEYPLGHCPELLLVGVSHVTTVYNLLQYEVLSCIFPALLKDPTKHNVMNYLWHTNPYFTLRGFVDAHSDPDCLLRTVDVCHDLKILSSVLDSTPFAFSIKLAAAALRKDYSHLEKWLTEKLSLYGKGFVEECVDFLKATMSNTDNVLEGMSQPQSIVKNLYWESCCVFIKVLQSHSGQLLSDVILDEIKKLCALYESRKPSSVVRELTNSEGGSDDIEVEANAYFQHMFSGQISVDSMIQMLGRFKESTNKREVSIFDCMISNLFEEYKFFPKYPDKQLKIAAVLFGSLIKHQLVAHLALGIALRGVLDSLRKSVDSKMFMFGTTALEQFMDRVIEWPQYCNHILQISHLRGTHFEMVSAIERALAKISSSQNEPNVGNLLSAEQHVSSSSSMEGTEVSESSWLMGTIPSQLGRPLSSPLQHRQQGLLGERSKISMSTLNKNIVSSQPPLVSSSADLTIPKTTATPSLLASPHQSTSVSTSLHTGFLRSRSTSGLPRQPSYTTGFGTALNIETLVAAAEQRDTPIETPPPEVQDKILFMINNISISNMEAKAKEFNEVIQEKYYPWFAQYMVMKRASIEPNFHDLYLKFFDKVNSKSLNKEILKATYENCKVLLRSDLIKSSSEERSLLKNLGSWLGKFTIGRNQALRAKEIDPKSLIVEAYEKGLMIAVIPFTSKILEPCQSSIAYRPPNPWTMGILSLLAEIYNLPNLKMNLKFDIEVLFKNLTVDIKDVKPTSLLKDRLREVEGNPDFSNKDVTASQTPVVAEVPSGTIPSLTHMEQQPEINITSRAMSLPNILNQYAAPVRLPTNSTVEDDKVALMMPEQVPSLTQVSPAQTQSTSPSPFSVNQLMAAIPREEIRFKINPKLGSLGPQLQYSKIMDLALDKANREIILPVIQRSVTIASRTTKELILKDYALESDNNTITRSAHLMVGTLAGSLAHVTCKEPLRVALYSNLRNLIQNLMSGSETIEQLIHTLINDNLDLGCAIIEAVATRQLEALIANDGKDVEIQSVIMEVPDILRRCVSRDEAALAVAQKVFKSLYDNTSNTTYVSWLLATLVAIRDVCKLVVKELTSWVIYSDEEKKFNIDIIFGLIRSELLNIGEYNVHLAKLIDGGRNKVATEFAMSLVQALFAHDPVGFTEFQNVLDALSKVLATRANKEENTANEITLVDPNQVAVLFSEWCQMCNHVSASDAAYTRFVTQLQQDGLLKGDDISERFFRILTELAVTHSLVSEQIVAPGGSSQQSPQQPHISYFSIDSYAKLVVMVLKYSVEITPNKASILSKILSVTVRSIQKDAEEKKASFNPRPYFRLFINWLYDLTTTDGHHDSSNFQVLTAFANAFHMLQPLRVPAWSFAWLELVSHRSFMPKLLMCNSQKGWPFFQRLLVALLKFMEPYLRNAELPEAMDLLYKGTMRVLLVLLHDFPEFLCDYHFSFCDVIPSSCIQMRNVILSAFPRNMRLPDPSTPNLKIDLLAEISIAPRIMSDVDGALKSKQLKTEVDEYLKRPEGSSFLSDLNQKLLLPQNEASVAGTRYNVPLINSLVFYVGIQAVQQLQLNKANPSASVQQINHISPMDIFQIGTATDIFRSLITSLDTEGRYLLLNAIANQLRYPNSHTHYYSFITLYLFSEATQEITQEQITRVLLERLIVNRPHPWGLLITFIELIKNPRYNFWSRSFTHCAPEIEKLFESVARSCGAKVVDEGISVQDGSH
ncbi:transcription regulator [Zea mays]|uniref:Transcription regulator n=1 Tax=Zea mays TaxID=4577 RepID=A0A1D6JJS9_MAIZE|nr:transcription regulator [Zea mays]